jgi:hypothetical protein
MIISLFNKADLLRLTVTFHRDVIDQVDSTVNELLFRKQSLED